MDHHHPAGKKNCTATVPIPTNDHRAILSAEQYNWPRNTLENPDRSPLLAAAACIRGFIDTVHYLVETLLGWIAEFLEALNEKLSEMFGEKWWLADGLSPICKAGVH